ncbi:porin family protein [Gangjinia marincola]|uniref:Porin family protein n=1 Tax=Gangjinia marincola TaxID=578463 RepID=A0ABN1MD48_9FLAO
MKKVFTLLLFLGLFGANAQNVKYGLKVGFNYSSLVFDDQPSIDGMLEEEVELPTFDDTYRIGFVFGGIAEIQLSNSFFLQPELMFSSQGSKDETSRINYLQVPILGKYRFVKNLDLQFGPQVGVKSWESEERDIFRYMDYAAVIGLGYTYKERYFADLRYTYGFADILRDSDQLNTTVNNQYVQFVIGYKL